MERITPSFSIFARLYMIDAHGICRLQQGTHGNRCKAGHFSPPGKPARRILRPSNKGESLATRFRCPCCGCKTLEAPGALALCPVCWWEDDGQEEGDAGQVRLTVNGALSLNEARENYARCGAAHPRFLPYVRKPQIAEQE
jgi:hypothetical protein